MESIIKEIELTQANLNKFELMNNSRKLRPSRVNELTKNIIQGIGLKSALHINLKNEKYRIIDGNHRFAACKNVLVDNSNAKIKIKLQIYKNMTENQEAELYDILQRNTAQTLNDFIQIHKEEMVILNMIDESFPLKVNIYSRKNAMLFTHLLKSYASRESTTVTIKNKLDLFEIGKSLNSFDYLELKKFFNNYLKYFGKPENLSPYYKMVCIWVIMSIYYRNRNVIPHEDLWNRIVKKIYGSPLILDLAKTNSCEYAAEQRRRLIENLNTGWRKNKFI